MPLNRRKFMAVSMLQNCCAVMAIRAEIRGGTLLHIFVRETR
jgi:hypothetical protein